MDIDELLEVSMDIGTNLMKYGADVHRVEDTVKRICRAYGISNVCAFAIRSNLTVTVSDDSGNKITDMRDSRIINYNLDRVERLNALSRKICEEHLSFSDVKTIIKDIENSREYPSYAKVLSYAAVGGIFSLFFGGGILESFFAVIIGFIIGSLDIFLYKIGVGYFLRIISLSAIITYVSYLLRGFFRVEPHLVAIGVMLVFVPGISITNSISNFLAKDYLAGVITLIEAVLTASTIAIGVAVAIKLL